MARQTTESSFDELTRGLASGTLSRGRALRLMGAALVGGTLASLGIGEAGADPPGCKRDGKKCKRNPQCCSGTCSGGCGAGCPPVACVGGMVNPDTCVCECAPPKTLMGGQCVCPAGQLPVCDFSGEIPQPTGRCEPVACPDPRPALCAESGQECCGRVNNQNPSAACFFGYECVPPGTICPGTTS